jgi:hypothetical protein
MQYYKNKYILISYLLVCFTTDTLELKFKIYIQSFNYDADKSQKTEITHQAQALKTYGQEYCKTGSSRKTFTLNHKK